MIILVINCGSSSIKFQLFDMPAKNVLAKGLIERIGEDDAKITYKPGDKKIVDVMPIKNHDEAFERLIEELTHPENGVIKSIAEIEAVGHRVVHGGEHYNHSVIIDDHVIQEIEACIDLAPLHNPPNLMGIQESIKLMPGIPNVAVFDTAFHQSLPEYAYLYSIPYTLYEKYRIRKYGFHGTSHAYVAERAAHLLGKEPDQVNLITCHLGNGCSVAAIKNGKSIDTSMGLTPLEGLMMGTRSGDLDPALIFYLFRKEEFSSVAELDDLLNKKSGLLGISGISNDQRNLEDLQDENERAKLALDMFDYRLKKYIGSYMSILGRVDAIVFTGGIGENGSLTRGKSTNGMEDLGVIIDTEKNDSTIRGKEGDISTPESKTKILVIPTDEEGRIAEDTFHLVEK
jgi:acetate kinase